MLPACIPVAAAPSSFREFVPKNMPQSDPGKEGGESYACMNKCTGPSRKNLAKFSDTCSVSADEMCIGSPRLVGGRKEGNSNMQGFFCTTL